MLKLNPTQSDFFTKAVQVLDGDPTYKPRISQERVLHKIVKENWEKFLVQTNTMADGRGLPEFVKKEFEEFLKCGDLNEGFLRVRCETCGHEKKVPFSCKRRGLCSSCLGRRMAESAAFWVDELIPIVPTRQWVISFPFPIRYLLATNSDILSGVLTITNRAIKGLIIKKINKRWKAATAKTAQVGSITVIQRFGDGLRLNPHAHKIYLDGVYVKRTGQSSAKSKSEWVFKRIPPLTDDDIKKLVETIRIRVLGYFKRKGYFDESTGFGANCDEWANEQPVLAQAQGASVQSKIAWGERAGQMVRRLGVMYGPGGEILREPAKLTGELCASSGGFSLHAKVAFEGHSRLELEKLCRYLARPPVTEKRLSISSGGAIVYRLKKRFSDGTEAFLFSPMEFMEKLAALMPKPRVNLIRYGGVLAPHAAIRDQVVIGKKLSNNDETSENGQDSQESNRDPRTNRFRIEWAKLLKRVFSVDVQTCHCGGKLKIIAAIKDPAVIKKILDHDRAKGLELSTLVTNQTGSRSPPSLLH